MAMAADLSVKSGWMLKKGEKRTNWSRRWFVLDHAGMLRYYESAEEGAELKGEIKLAAAAGCTEIRPSTHPKAEPAEIEIACTERTYRFRPDNTESQAGWFRGFSSTGLLSSLASRPDVEELTR